VGRASRSSDGGFRWSLRPGGEADSEALAALHVASWRATYRDDLPAEFLARLDPTVRANGWRHWFRETPMRVSVAAVADRMIGFVAYGPVRDRDVDPTAVCQIYNLHVAPGEGGRGIGSALFQAAVADARSLGFRGLSLWVVVTNARARRFYERAGLEPDGATQAEPLEPGVVLSEMRYRAPIERIVRRAGPATE
jgi:ribosomal protein S18 acetylase RimI-like enzyme